LALGSIAAALGLAVLVDPIRLLSPFFLFYAAVALSSWYGGLGPGLVATLLGAVLAAHFALPPLGSFAPMSVGLFARLLLFVTVGALIAGLNGELHKAYGRCEVEAHAARAGEAEVRRHQARLHALASELMRAEERERRRIAVILHDSVNASLAQARRKIHAMRRANAEPASAGDLDELGRIIDDTIRQTRSLTSELSPPVLYELGLGPALRWLCERFGADGELVCDYEADDQPKPLGDEARLVLFQAARELLANVQRHAKARRCLISFRREGGRARMSVEDDGRGFNPTTNGYSDGRTGGFGLFNIRERLVNLGGELEMASEPGRGSTARIVVPRGGAPARSYHVEGPTYEHQSYSCP
jgi:signal transduction histidine kinase